MAGVMIESLLALRCRDTGFDPKNVLTMRVILVDARYPSPAQRSSFFEAALQTIRALPGLKATGRIDDLPLASGGSQTLALEGSPPQREPDATPDQPRRFALTRRATPRSTSCSKSPIEQSWVDVPGLRVRLARFSPTMCINEGYGTMRRSPASEI